MGMSDELPDAPWIVESWHTGGCPGCQETPYERSGPDDFLEGADSEYGWRILCWMLNVDEDDADEDEFQNVWGDLTEKARKSYCKLHQQMHHDDSAEMYNEYWRRWKT